MKVILQDYEPRPLPTDQIAQHKPQVRKPRLRLMPAVTETRLFHAL
ncbi:MAG: hypothetical protein RL490_646 [Pseudomonadota bacterium]